MAAPNVKKGDGYICSGTCLDFPESWRAPCWILAHRAYKQRLADRIATMMPIQLLQRYILYQALKLHLQNGDAGE